MLIEEMTSREFEGRSKNMGEGHVRVRVKLQWSFGEQIFIINRAESYTCSVIRTPVAARITFEIAVYQISKILRS